MVGLPLFGKEGSGTPVFNILVRALIFYNIFKYVIFQMRQNALMWSKGLTHYLQVSSADKIFTILHLKILLLYLLS